MLNLSATDAQPRVGVLFTHGRELGWAKAVTMRERVVKPTSGWQGRLENELWRFGEQQVRFVEFPLALRHGH